MCKCPPNSPFHWATRNAPSIADATMKVVGKTQLSGSQRATVTVAKQKKMGKNPSNIPGMGRNAEKKPKRSKQERTAEVIRLRDFTTYSRVRREELLGVANSPHYDDDLPAGIAITPNGGLDA